MAVHEGEILRKKNKKNAVVIAVKGSGDERAKPFSVGRDGYEFLCPSSLVRVYYDSDGVNEIQLIRSSPDPTCVKIVLQGHAIKNEHRKCNTKSNIGCYQ